MTFNLDPNDFLESAIDEETKAFNKHLMEIGASNPDMWSFPAHQVRAARLEGAGPFPVEAEEPTAFNLATGDEAGDPTVRIFKPKKTKPVGSYLHIHGGGWVLGSAMGQDERLQEIADNCNLNCVSVEYRLAPEFPYPAGPDDCEAAALWLLEADHDLETGFLAIGGESAGANLSVVTLLRLRERLGQCPFHAAVLVAGVYDLGQTASARNWGHSKLILNTRDMQMFAHRYIQGAHDLSEADISPLFANLDAMPAAHFSVGTKDLLVDDTLQMATRWQVAGGNAELDVTAGGCHVFQSFRHLHIAKASNEKIDHFLSSQAARKLKV